jgi:DNA polymerase I-like protein with 3'-5' exonuclease and polymerase domains
MLLVADVENKVTRVERWNAKGTKSVDIDNSPFNAENYLVSTGLAIKDREGAWFASYHFHSHLHLSQAHSGQAHYSYVQSQLDACTLLIGHNVRYDLQWLWAAGFRYDGPVYDTMLAEYVLARGQKGISMSLDNSAKRRNVALKKGELVADYWDRGIGYEAMPIPVVYEYGMADVVSAGELYDAQVALYELPENVGLKKTLHLMNEFCRVLARMETDGIKIDREALDAVEAEFMAEKAALQSRMEEIARGVMGDTPINLDSPEQLSQVVYSRRLNNKKSWVTYWLQDGVPINRRITQAAFKRVLDDNTTVMQKTKAEQCPNCKGTGYIRKTKKDGEPYAKAFVCAVCEKAGFLYKPTGKVAGFKFNPADADWASANGLTTDKERLLILAGVARSRDMNEAEEFLEGMVRLNAVNTYLDSFVGGIKRSVRHDGLLHASFDQHGTSTGRLASRRPNMHNMPRSGTFPVKRAIVSRFAGGRIAEGDFSQLEFRSAGELSGCERIESDVLNGVDVHSETARILTEAGEPRTRQEAKSRTFRPLYGGLSGSPAEVVYNKAFLVKYAGVAEWHRRLQEEAIATKKIVLPTGREYAFPYCKRSQNGGATQATKIKNYPVQGFATADIVPWAVIRLAKAMRLHNCKSVLINTVHDSIVVDMHPDEFDLIPRLMYEAMVGVKDHMKDFYGITMRIPLEIEIKTGDNWMTDRKVNLDAYKMAA